LRRIVRTVDFDSVNDDGMQRAATRAQDEMAMLPEPTLCCHRIEPVLLNLRPHVDRKAPFGEYLLYRIFPDKRAAIIDTRRSFVVIDQELIGKALLDDRLDEQPGCDGGGPAGQRVLLERGRSLEHRATDDRQGIIVVSLALQSQCAAANALLNDVGQFMREESLTGVCVR